MAALRSAMAMLGRRCSGSSSAASMGGKGIFRAAPPSLPPAAVRNLEVNLCISVQIWAHRLQRVQIWAHRLHENAS